MSLGEEASGPLRRPLGKGAIVQILNHVDFWRVSTKAGQEGRPDGGRAEGRNNRAPQAGDAGGEEARTPRAPANHFANHRGGGGEQGEEKAALQDAFVAGGACITASQQACKKHESRHG